MQTALSPAITTRGNSLVKPSDTLILILTAIALFFGAPTVGLLPETLSAIAVTLVVIYLIFNRPHVAVALYVIIQTGILGFFEHHDLPCVTRSFFTLYISDTMFIIWLISLWLKKPVRIRNREVRSLTTIMTVLFTLIMVQVLVNLVFGNDPFNIPIRLSRKYLPMILFFLILRELPARGMQYVMNTVIIISVLGALLHLYILITKDDLLLFNTSYHENKFNELSQIGAFEVTREYNRAGKILPEFASVLLFMYIKLYSKNITRYFFSLFILLASVALSYTRSLYFEFVLIYGYGFTELFRHVSSRYLANAVVVVVILASLFLMYEGLLSESSTSPFSDAKISSTKELFESFAIRTASGIHDVMYIDGTLGQRVQRESGKLTNLGIGAQLLFGVGFNSIRQKLIGMDSGIVEFMLDIGLVGTILLVFLGVYVYRVAFVGINNLPINAKVSLKVLGFTILLMLIISVVQTYIVDGIFYGLMIGLLARLREHYHVLSLQQQRNGRNGIKAVR